jgi:hypothetical protein
MLMGIQVGRLQADVQDRLDLQRKFVLEMRWVNLAAEGAQKEGPPRRSQFAARAQRRDLPGGRERRVFAHRRQMNTDAELRLIGKPRGGLSKSRPEHEHRRARNDALTMCSQDGP